jgi:hypothetical protein
VPSGGSLGRNLRSKTRWFTGFCNSHHVSHFATFFIDARAEISVAESHISFVGLDNRRSPRAARRCLSFTVFLGVIPRRIPTSNRRAPKGEREEAGGAEEAASASAAAFCHVFDGRVSGKATTMILPQVHLRKPCYDFSFL